MTNGEIPECFSLKSITVAVTTAMCFYVGAIPAQATNLFNPVPGTVEHNGDLVLTNTGTQFDPTGIGFIGGQTTTPIEFDFNGKVELNLKQESMTADEKWSAYGVWVRNSEQGNAHIKFNKDLIVNVENTTNMGVGLVCDSNYDSVGGPQGQDNGSTITLNGASTINVKGNSIIGAAAGSMFNNNSNGGGHLVFGSVPSSKLHIINVTSDWSSKTNTSKDSDWAIGLLAFDRGGVMFKAI